MGTKGPKWCTLLIIIVLISLLSTSYAGAHERRFFNKYEGQMRSVNKETPKKNLGRESAIDVPRSRDLRAVKTDDYGGYDPSPSMAKPPFKLIPN